MSPKLTAPALALAAFLAGYFAAGLGPELPKAHAQDSQMRFKEWQAYVKRNGEVLAPSVNRIRVPGGWLFLYTRGGLAFVPDPKHSWTLREK